MIADSEDDLFDTSNSYNNIDKNNNDPHPSKIRCCAILSYHTFQKQQNQPKAKFCKILIKTYQYPSYAY